MVMGSLFCNKTSKAETLPIMFPTRVDDYYFTSSGSAKLGTAVKYIMLTTSLGPVGQESKRND